MSESASKAFDLLFYLATSGGTTLAKLARDTGWDKATALRYLTALEKKGVVERRDNDWTLGLSIIELASHVPVTENITNRVRPILVDLAKKTAETANLAAIVGNDMIYLDKADSGRVLRLRAAPGDRLPLYCTAAGKCILSKLSVPVRNQYLMNTKLIPVAPNTITDKPTLTAEIEKTIRQGWAMDNEEFESGLICYGVPLDLQPYGFTGALSVSGPSSRMLNAQSIILEYLNIAAGEIQKSLGCELGNKTTPLFSPARGGFNSTDWHRPGTELCE